MSDQHEPERPGEDSFAAALAALGRRLEELCRTDEGLRRQLRGVGRLLVEIGQEAEVRAAPEPPVVRASLAEALERAARELAPAQAEAPRQPVPPMATHAAIAASGIPPPPTAEDLSLIERHCRLKAEGSRWAAERQRRLADGADFAREIEPRDRELLDRARTAAGPFLWMNHPGMTIPERLSLLDDLGGCFDALAASVALARDVEREPGLEDDRMETVLALVAEAQSALRAGVGDLDDVRMDPDQARTHAWLKAVAMERRVFIRRHMRLDDPADPSAWHDLLSRIEALHAAITDARERVARRRSLLNRTRYHVKLILHDANGGRLHDWSVAIDCVERLVGDGMPPSNTDVRDMLLPLLDRLPEELPDLPPGFLAVLREADRYVASRQAETPQAPPVRSAEAPQVAEVMQLLAGREVVLIGGRCRVDARRSLEAAFGLQDLTWIETREHQSIASFEPLIARPEVALVMLAIRWSSHSFGDVKRFCDAHGKPLVRLPAGYGVNQVAAQVARQASVQLGAVE